VAEACRERMHVMLVEEVERLRAGDCEDDQDAARWKEAMAACFTCEVGGADEDEDTDSSRRGLVVERIRNGETSPSARNGEKGSVD
jgi:hypothetical protein